MRGEIRLLYITRLPRAYSSSPASRPGEETVLSPRYLQILSGASFFLCVGLRKCKTKPKRRKHGSKLNGMADRVRVQAFGRDRRSLFKKLYAACISSSIAHVRFYAVKRKGLHSREGNSGGIPLGGQAG